MTHAKELLEKVKEDSSKLGEKETFYGPNREYY
jgi:hypothetical protein